MARPKGSLLLGLEKKKVKHSRDRLTGPHQISVTQIPRSGSYLPSAEPRGLSTLPKLAQVFGWVSACECVYGPSVHRITQSQVKTQSDWCLSQIRGEKRLLYAVKVLKIILNMVTPILLLLWNASLATKRALICWNELDKDLVSWSEEMCGENEHKDKTVFQAVRIIVCYLLTSGSRLYGDCHSIGNVWHWGWEQ